MLFRSSGKGVYIKSSVVAKDATKLLKKDIPNSTKKVVEIDPCSRGSSYRSSC